MHTTERSLAFVSNTQEGQNLLEGILDGEQTSIIGRRWLHGNRDAVLGLGDDIGHASAPDETR